MKIVKSLILAPVVGLIGLGIGSLDGCATAGQDASVAQGLGVVCAQFNVVNPQLEAFNAVLVADPATNKIGVKATADLAAAQKPIAALCAAGATVTSTQLLTAVQQALPAFAIVVAEVPLPPAQQAQIQSALVLAEGAVGLVGVVESQIAAAKLAAPATASTAATPAK